MTIPYRLDRAPNNSDLRYRTDLAGLWRTIAQRRAAAHDHAGAARAERAAEVIELPVVVARAALD